MNWNEVLEYVNAHVDNEEVLRKIGKGYGISVDEPLKKSYKPIKQTTAYGINYEAASTRNPETATLVFERLQEAIGMSRN